MSIEKNIAKKIIFSLFTIFYLHGCAVIRPGEVGVKQHLGRLDKKIHEPGSVVVFPLTTKVVKVPTRTMNLEVKLNLPCVFNRADV